MLSITFRSETIHSYGKNEPSAENEKYSSARTTDEFGEVHLRKSRGSDRWARKKNLYNRPRHCRHYRRRRWHVRLVDSTSVRVFAWILGLREHHFYLHRVCRTSGAFSECPPNRFDWSLGPCLVSETEDIWSMKWIKRQRFSLTKGAANDSLGCTVQEESSSLLSLSMRRRNAWRESNLSFQQRARGGEKGRRAKERKNVTRHCWFLFLFYYLHIRQMLVTVATCAWTRRQTHTCDCSSWRSHPALIEARREKESTVKTRIIEACD